MRGADKPLLCLEATYRAEALTSVGGKQVICAELNCFSLKCVPLNPNRVAFGIS